MKKLIIIYSIILLILAYPMGRLYLHLNSFIEIRGEEFNLWCRYQHEQNNILLITGIGILWIIAITLSIILFVLLCYYISKDEKI
ncbi:MAG: hypothetical protein ACFFC1_15035 [Promethearchaeota archaeon]